MRKGLQRIKFIKQPDAGDLRISSSIVTDAGVSGNHRAICTSLSAFSTAGPSRISVRQAAPL